MMLRFLCAVLIVADVSFAGAQKVVELAPTLVLPSMSGSDIFGYYCASCHGRNGRGDGPLSAELKTPPADLTMLAAANRGQFPTERVRDFVTHGRPGTPAHGSAEMPVWGPIFQSLDPSDDVAMARIDNVVAFVRSLQRK